MSTPCLDGADFGLLRLGPLLAAELAQQVSTIPSKVAETSQVGGQVLGLGLAALLPPEADQGGFVVAHDDPGVRAADKGAATLLRFCPRLRFHVVLRG